MKYLFIVGAIAALVGCAAAPPGPSPWEKLRKLSFEEIANHATVNKQYLVSRSEKELLDASLEAAKSELKDPGSAQFRDVRIIPHSNGKLICGEINGKNSYGGYVGFRLFAASPSGATILRTGGKLAEVDDLANAGLRAGCGR